MSNAVRNPRATRAWELYEYAVRMLRAAVESGEDESTCSSLALNARAYLVDMGMPTKDRRAENARIGALLARVQR